MAPPNQTPILARMALLLVGIAVLLLLVVQLTRDAGL